MSDNQDFLDAKRRIEACPLKGASKSYREALVEYFGEKTKPETKTESFFYHAKTDAWFTKASDDTQTFLGVLTIAETQQLMSLARTRDYASVSINTPMNDGRLVVVYEGIEDKEAKISQSLPTGVYKFTKSYDYGIGVKKATINTDKYVDLHSEQTKEIGETIDIFMKSRQSYKDLDLLHKRGILLYGPPGNGKSMFIKNIIQKYANTARIFLYESGTISLASLNSIKNACMQDEIPNVFILEEITTHTENQNAGPLLDFLDGESTWDNILVLAATNYPEKLPGNFVDRPSRFDSLHRIGAPESKVVEEFLVSKLGREAVTEPLLDYLAKLSKEELSIAYLKELASAVKTYGKDPIETIKSFKERKEHVKKEFAPEKKIKVGFSSSIDDDED